MRLRTILILILLAAAAAAVIWYLSGTEIEEAAGGSGPGGRPPQALAVNAVVIQPAPFSERVTLTGSIMANEAVAVKSEISGRIVEIGFSEGQRVLKGQMLARLFDADLQARLRQTLSQVELDSESVHRLEQIRRVDGISIEELQRAKATLAMHRAEADVIRAQIAKTVIQAPFNGIVGLRDVSEGAVVSPETQITLLKDDSRLKLECSVPEKYATLVRIGSPLSFVVRGTRSAKRYQATVYAFDPELDPGSRTLRLRAAIEQPQGILPGMFADVQLDLGQIADAILVPTEAVVVDINGAKLFVKEGATAREVRVETGTRTRENIRIADGLAAGDTVLTTGMLIMKDGMPVSVTVVE